MVAEIVMGLFAAKTPSSAENVGAKVTNMCGICEGVLHALGVRMSFWLQGAGNTAWSGYGESETWGYTGTAAARMIVTAHATRRSSATLFCVNHLLARLDLLNQRGRSGFAI